MNFLDTFDKLSILHEEGLMEKLWVTINPNNSNNYYRFFTLNNQDLQVEDVVNMLSKHNGTYKQTLDKDIFKELVDELKEISKSTKTPHYSDPLNFKIVSEDEAKKNNGTIKTLTLTDRVLRQNAQVDFSKIRETDTALSKELGTQKCLIHHINGHEDETTKENIVLVPYFPNDKDDLKIANGIHSVLHVTAKNTIKTSPINYDTSIYYFDKTGALKKGKCNIVIEL